MTGSPPDQLVYLHVMKAGGTSLVARLVAAFSASLRYPRRTPGDSGDSGWFEHFYAYQDAIGLTSLPADELRSFQLISGHFPFAVVERLPGQPFVTTLLREPVERTISWLHHCKRYAREHADSSLEEIYEDTWYRERFTLDHQCNVFGMTMDEVAAAAAERGPLDPTYSTEREAIVAAGWAIDSDPDAREARFERAKENLRRVDLLGVTEEFDRFVARLSERLGVGFDDLPDLHVGARETVSDALRARIEADCRLDAELYAFARDLAAG